MPTGLAVTHPITGEHFDGLGRQLRAHELWRRRGDGRAGARRTRLRVRSKYGYRIKQVIDVDCQSLFDHRQWQRLVRRQAARPLAAIGLAQRAGHASEAVDTIATDLSHCRPGREEDHVAPARLGHQPSALLGHTDPDHSLPGLWRRAGARKGLARRAARRPGARRQRQPVAQERGVSPCRLPAVRRAVPARNRHDGHIRRFGLVLHALCLPGCQGRDGRRAQRLLDADGPVHRRHRARRAAPALCALLDQGHARHRSGAIRRAVHQALHPGHAAQRELLPRRRRRQEAVVLPERSRMSSTTSAARRSAPPPSKTACR